VAAAARRCAACSRALDPGEVVMEIEVSGREGSGTTPLLCRECVERGVALAAGTAASPSVADPVLLWCVIDETIRTAVDFRHTGSSSV
jgi:hypothetical protein